MYNYNTQQPALVLKEYGRNVQKLVEYIGSIQDYEMRTKYAQTLVLLMKQLTPETKNNVEYQSKFWDDLFIMAQFELEIDSPFPMPEKSALGKKPQQIPYNTHEILYKHYGRNIELLIAKALEINDLDEAYSEFIYIAQLMRTFYTNWNKDHIDDKTLAHHLKILSKNQIKQEILDRIAAGENQRSNRNNSDRNKNHSNNKGNQHNNNNANRFGGKNRKRKR